MTYFAYLDEFGHVGPYVARTDPKYRESPVFGLAGFVLPADEVRGFGTWFFQRKCEFLAFEIDRSEKHPALWEKKGSSLYTVTNVSRYPALRAHQPAVEQDRGARRLCDPCRGPEDLNAGST